GAGHGVQQLDAPVLEARQHRVDVGLEAQVVKALSTLGQKAPHSIGGVEWLEQLDLGLAGSEQGRAHALIDDRRFLDERQAERVAIESVGRLETLHDDPRVMNPSHDVLSSQRTKGAARGACASRTGIRWSESSVDGRR